MDDRLPIVVRVEKRNIPMRRIISALRGAFVVQKSHFDIKEVYPQNPDKLELIDRLRSIVHGVVATAEEHKSSAAMCAHVSISPLTFMAPGHPKRDINVAIVATASIISPLWFEVLASPSAATTETESALLHQYRMRMRKELPKFECVHWTEGDVLSRSVAELIFRTVFMVADGGMPGDDASLQ